MKTRLDPVVRFREGKEQKALEGLARATQTASQAEARLGHAKERALHDARGSGDAAEWAMIEAARERALVDVKRATDEFTQSTQVVEAARSSWRSEHKSTEVVRRVADARREEARHELARRDTRELDALGSMLFWRKKTA